MLVHVKSENIGYFEKYWSMRPEKWKKQTTNEGMRLIKVKIISSPGSNVIDISKLKTSFSQ